jgi:hypothetical protein
MRGKIKINHPATCRGGVYLASAAEKEFPIYLRSLISPPSGAFQVMDVDVRSFGDITGCPADGPAIFENLFPPGDGLHGDFLTRGDRFDSLDGEEFEPVARCDILDDDRDIIFGIMDQGPMFHGTRSLAFEGFDPFPINVPPFDGGGKTGASGKSQSSR